MDDQKPQEIMAEAVNTPKGISITFASKEDMLSYRFRCYSARNTAEKRAKKLAIETGLPVEETGWEDLVFLPKEEDGVIKLWIGEPDAKTFGILSIERQE